MQFISGDSIHNALEHSYRVYLCGDLQQPQDLPWIHDERNEIGISYYKEFTSDKPHFHSTATEYNLVLSGCSKVLLLEEMKEYTFEAGSLFVFPPMTKYASKHTGGTTVLFFKSPGGNDKHLIDIDPDLRIWLSSWHHDHELHKPIDNPADIE